MACRTVLDRTFWKRLHITVLWVRRGMRFFVIPRLYRDGYLYDRGGQFDFRAPFKKGDYKRVRLHWLWLRATIYFETRRLTKAADRYMMETYGDTVYKWVDPDLRKEHA